MELQTAPQITLTDLETGDSLVFAMLPERISLRIGTVFQSYSIMGVGEVKIPAGDELNSISWSAVLPGEKRLEAPFVDSGTWLHPQEAHNLLENWRKDKAMLRLLITDTPINTDVYVQRYDGEFSGAFGDYKYSITLIQAKAIVVTLSGETRDGSNLPPLVNTPERARPAPPASSTYTIVAGDSLWSIAQATLGDGSRYPELYSANSDLMQQNEDKSGQRYMIYPGQTLSIPL